MGDGIFLLRLADVVQRTSLGRSTIYRKIAEGSFPAPLHLGPGCVRWDAEDLTAWRANLRPANDNAAARAAA